MGRWAMPHLYPLHTSTIPVKGSQAKRRAQAVIHSINLTAVAGPAAALDRRQRLEKPCSTKYWEARQLGAARVG